MSHEAKQTAYGADITYGTNNEFGFDYLRDNMVFSLAEKVQRKLAFAVVDEVDSILIDEARTPLLISGPADDNVEMYQRMNGVPAMLTRQTEEEGSGRLLGGRKSPHGNAVGSRPRARRSHPHRTGPAGGGRQYLYSGHQHHP